MTTKKLWLFPLPILALSVFIRTVAPTPTLTQPDTPLPIPAPTFRHDLNLTPQATGRTWQDRQFTHLASVGRGIIKFPQELTTDADGNVFVIDFEERLIDLFSLDGTTTFIGNVDGQSVLMKPTSIAIDNRLRAIWVADLDGQKLVAFSYDNKIVKQFTTETKPLRVLPTSSGILVMTIPVRPQSFERYSLDGVYQKSFGQFLTDQTGANGIVLDGELSDSRTGMVYAGYRAGIISSFNEDGTMRYSRTTVSPVPIPSLLARRKDCRGFPPNTPHATLSLMVIGDRIYTTDGRGVDVYGLNDGTYLSSFKLPHSCKALSLQGSRAYCLTEDKEITIWKMGA